MELSKRYKVFLLRAKANPIFWHKTKKLVKGAKDLELVKLYDLITAELIQRGILINE